LVDFRGFDTMGEISVLLMASLGVLVLLAGSGPVGPRALTPLSEDRFPAMLTSVTRPMLSLVLLMAVYIFLRGHNLPGGGFIGGLVAATSAVLLALAFGVNRARAVLRVPPTTVLAVGLALAASAGVIGLLQGQAFLTGGWLFPGGLPLGTPLLFDVGVFFTVLGGVLLMLFRLLERED
ncbi:MAG TPA: NADH-quinone oxidoreductase subunit I, partial [Thauera sp.]|nr:NADH-quinone oxidoreductase subunit I [Thauera sp.]